MEKLNSTRAGFIHRLGAYLIDTAIAIPICMLAMKLTIDKAYYPFLTEIYIMLFFTLCNTILGATLGKLILGLRVVNSSNKKIGIFKSFIRELLKVLLAYVFLINFIWLLFGKEKLTLHDVLARTQVIHYKKGV
jgi:uncharacterized RDD family membrane protein YckC